MAVKSKKSAMKRGKSKATAKAAAAPAAKKLSSVKDSFTKSETFQYLGQRSSLKKGSIVQVMDALGEILEAHLKKGGPGVYTLPGLLKFKVVRKPATKARKGINPFTGEPTTFKAKPARNVIKIKALKKLKEMV